jgi:integrase
MAALRKRDSISARALEFCILTAARTGEAIGAKWNEIDIDAALWTIPAARMKGGREHTVPLSKRATAMLEGLPRVGEHVFTASPDGAPLGHSALLELLRGMAGNGYTVHGFRSAFRDWAGDQTHFPRDVIEFALAHKVKDKTEAAYRRSSALEKRRKLMDTWAAYCGRPTSSGNVVSLHGAA